MTRYSENCRDALRNAEKQREMPRSPRLMNYDIGNILSIGEGPDSSGVRFSFLNMRNIRVSLYLVLSFLVSVPLIETLNETCM